MKKILLKGPNIWMENKNPNVIEIKNLDDLPLDASSEIGGHEYFINAHGSVSSNLGLWGKIKSYLKPEPSYLKMDIFSDESTTSVLDVILLNKIQNNIIKNQCNIVHIFSCHSGAAQHHLDNVQGNIVLCTYNKASDANIMQLAQSNYDNRTKYDSSLIEYIRENFHLLAASDFSISYKLEGQIHNFSLSADKIKNMKSIEKLPTFLHKEYKAFKNFIKIFILNIMTCILNYLI